MAIQHDKSGARLHQAKNPTPTDEASWQQLMVFNYVVFEAIDAMKLERAAGNHTPLNHHWQQFIYHLRLNKPKLGTCLDRLLAELEVTQ